jgi:trehalose 6-phosphate phosphatase
MENRTRTAYTESMNNTHPWQQHTEALLNLIAKPRFGIISDFDGTLSHFVTRPDAGAMTPANVQTLDTLAETVTVIALVSGRGAEDLYGRFPRPWGVYYGNHGMESWRDGGLRVAPEAASWLEPLQALLAAFGQPDIPGVFVENKGVSASIHYRMAGDTAGTRQILYERLHPLIEQYGFRLSEGQFIWEVKPPVSLSKGTAAQAIVDEYQLQSALFLGDDITDIHAMQQLRRLAGDPASNLSALSVGVIHPTTPAAVYESCDLTADGVDDTEVLLAWIVQHRPAPPPSTPPQPL